MKNKNSISFTITVTFIISIIIVTLSMAVLFGITQKREHFIIHKKAIEISKMVFREHRANQCNISADFQKYLSQLNYNLIESIREKQDILNHKKLKKIRRIKHHQNFIDLCEINEKKYIIIFTPKEPVILEDKNNSYFLGKWIILIYIAIIILLLILYFTIMNKLKPVKILHENIKQLSNENFNISTPTNKKDEISLLCNEFYNTAMKLKKIKESRNIFIRNIMHELKTPITKGKLLSELKYTNENKEKMKNVFLRLEALIVEFASIEELISTKKQLDKKEYFLEDIIDESCELLMIEDRLIEKSFDPTLKINIDFKLFTIALKNLIDNGIKYSDGTKVTIKYENNTLIFENQGDPLQYPLEQYFEPFFKGDNIKSNESFGLGLYIVHHILKAHNMHLSYEHENNKNIFSITTNLQ